MTVIQITTPQAYSAPELPPILREAKADAIAKGLSYAGLVAPQTAWKLFVGGRAHLVDVRSIEERRCGGHVPNTLHIAWEPEASLIDHSTFVHELENTFSKQAILLFYCASGEASAAAAARATAAGFTAVFQVKDNLEGDAESYQKRSDSNEWRQRGLPWVQH